MTIIQKFVILAALLSGLGLAFEVQSPNDSDVAMLRCCSFCDQQPWHEQCDGGCNANC